MVGHVGGGGLSYDADIKTRVHKDVTVRYI